MNRLHEPQRRWAKYYGELFSRLTQPTPENLRALIVTEFRLKAVLIGPEKELRLMAMMRSRQF
jgi:hypothetical protein